MFAPSIERKVLAPVYAYGQNERLKDPVFTCPVSAIPGEVWHVLELWFQCRAMKLPPRAGGVLDQPWIVRRAFPVLEQEWEQLESKRQQLGQLETMAIAMGASKRPPGGRRQ